MLLPTSKKTRSMQSWNSPTDLHSSFSLRKIFAFFGVGTDFTHWPWVNGNLGARTTSRWYAASSRMHWYDNEDPAFYTPVGVWSCYHDFWVFGSYFHTYQGFMQDVRQPWINSILLDNEVTTAWMLWFWEVLVVKDIMYFVVSLI